MSIFNATAPSGGGGGLEYEEGTFSLSSAKTSYEITFSNSHTSPPALVMAECTNSTSSNYTTFIMCIVYGLLFGTARGGSSSYYAQRISGRGSTTSMTVNSSTTEANMSSAGITSSAVTLTTNSSYGMYYGNWKWIAIWK